jgi:hypothetical protein
LKVGALDGVPLIGLSAPGLAAFFFLLMYTGRVVPRSTLVDKKEESERWRLAYEKEREARGAADAQARELLEVSKTTHHIVLALFQNAQEAAARGGSRDALPKT